MTSVSLTSTLAECIVTILLLETALLAGQATFAQVERVHARAMAVSELARVRAWASSGRSSDDIVSESFSQIRVHSTGDDSGGDIRVEVIPASRTVRIRRSR